MEQVRPGQFLSFSLADLSYALPISSVREINRVMPITPIPETPDYICGVMNLRGKVIPILDLRARFGLKATPYTRQTCIIIVDSDKGQAGLLVDAIHGVLNLQADQIEGRPQLGNDPNLTFVVGMGKIEKKVLILVDVGRILTNTPIESLTKTAA